MKYEELHTDRLYLRALKETDVNEILFLRSDITVNKFVKRELTKNKDEALKFIKKIKNNMANQSVCYWSITKVSHPKTIGTICLWNFSADFSTAEVGYDLHPDFHGKGIMTEALKAVLDFGFNRLNLENIEAYTQHNNLASLRLLYKQNFNQIPLKIDEGNADNIVLILNKSSYKA
jgi:ribosomal-protein-alanine N-acetyltransferase